MDKYGLLGTQARNCYGYYSLDFNHSSHLSAFCILGTVELKRQIRCIPLGACPSREENYSKIVSDKD